MVLLVVLEWCRLSEAGPTPLPKPRYNERKCSNSEMAERF